MRELTVIDLFAGIGGFSYGLHNASPMFKTVAFAEIDEFCQKVLKKNFGNVKIYEDVRDVRIEQPVFLVCGGFPCQGFSVAGLQRGTKDNRYLWPEMFDVIKHAKPRWVIAENVRGIVNVEDGVAFDKVHTDLESYGYEVQTFCIPASAKGAWHRRERIWFVACNPDVVYPHDFRCEQHTEAEEKGNGRAEASSFSGGSHASDSESERTGEPGEPHKEKRLEGGNAAQSNGGGAVDVPDSSVIRPSDESNGNSRGLEEKGEEEERGGNKPSLRTETRSTDVPDSDIKGLERHGRHSELEELEQSSNEPSQTDSYNGKGKEGQYVSDSKHEGYEKRLQPETTSNRDGQGIPKCEGDWSEIIAQFRGVPDGVSTELDKTRTNRIKSLGNSIVSQIVEEIGRAIIKAESKQ